MNARCWISAVESFDLISSDGDRWLNDKSRSWIPGRLASCFDTSPMAAVYGAPFATSPNGWMSWLAVAVTVRPNAVMSRPCYCQRFEPREREIPVAITITLPNTLASPESEGPAETGFFSAPGVGAWPAGEAMSPGVSGTVEGAAGMGLSSPRCPGVAKILRFGVSFVARFFCLEGFFRGREVGWSSGGGGSKISGAVQYGLRQVWMCWTKPWMGSVRGMRDTCWDADEPQCTCKDSRMTM